MSGDQNKATVQRWVEEVWNRGSFALADDVIASTYEMHGGAPSPIRGPAGITQYIAAYRQGMPDLHLTVDDLVAEADKVAWRFTARGTQTDTLLGIPPSGKSAVVTGIVISRFAKGKWQEDWVSFDALGMLQQLGVVPTSSEV